MKKYKLLKDLPFAKSGEVLYIRWQEDGGYFTIYKDMDKMSAGDLHEGYIDNFDEWFEEEPKIYFTIGFFRKEIVKISEKEIMGYAIDNVKSSGLLFETKEEAEKHLEYLKAKTIIKEDAKGAKFDWTDIGRVKYCGVWNCKPDILNKQLGLEYRRVITDRASTIYFNSEKDIQESFEKHPEEWKTYLTYKQ